MNKLWFDYRAYVCVLPLLVACAAPSADESSEAALDGEHIGLVQQGLGGAITATTGLPAVVQLFKHAEPGTGGNEGCTGTVIGSQIILTAAHCVTPEGSSVDVYRDNDFSSGGMPFAVSTVAYVDPEFEFDPMAHDTAFLELPTAAPMTPMPLHSHALQVDDALMLLGYGANTAGVAGKYAGPAQVGSIENEFVLTKVGATYAHTCGGDSGGPAFTTSAPLDLSTWRLSGIQTWGAGNCNSATASAIVPVQNMEAPLAWLAAFSDVVIEID